MSSCVYLYTGAAAAVVSALSFALHFLGEQTGHGSGGACLAKVSGADAQDLISRGQVDHVIDVRPRSAYRQGHHPHAYNVPLAEVSEKQALIGTLARDSTVLVYCSSAAGARKGAGALCRAGFGRVYYTGAAYKKLIEKQ